MAGLGHARGSALRLRPPQPVGFDVVI